MRLVFGRAGTGKNRYVFEDIEKTVATSSEVCLLVPEQTLFSIEKRLLLALGPERFRYVTVVSFSRLADRVLKSTGNAFRERINDAAKVSLIRRAIDSLGDDISFYRRKRNQVSFHKLVASVIDECKEALATPTKLEQLSVDSELRTTRSKLHELSLIYSKYEELLKDRYEDSLDRLTAAAVLLAKSGLVKDKTVYIDGFTSFSGPEYRLLSSIAKESKEVVITLLGDKEIKHAEAFLTVQRTEARIRDIFKDKKIEEIYNPCENTFLAPGIAVLERFLLLGEGEESSQETDLTGLYLFNERGPYEELRRVAAEITDLVRNHNYRYDEIAIIARNIGSYRSVVERTMRLYDIPYFADWTKNESYSAISTFIKSSLLLLEEPTAENILSILKTGLTSLSVSDISAFENYIYVWKLDRSKLTKVFSNNPNGFSEVITEEGENLLLQAEKVRNITIGWVKEFLDNSKNMSASEIIKQIYLMMVSSGAINTLAQRKEAGIAVDLLEQLHHLLKDDYLTSEEIIGLAEVLFNETYVGRIPPMVSQVQVGAANRIRTNQPKVVFVLGLLEGIFPLSNFEFPLLSHKERGYISENGVELVNSFDNLLLLEQLYFYNALTSGSERVYLSTPKESVGNEVLEPCERIGSFLEKYMVPTAPTVNNRFSLVINEATAKVAYLEDMELRRDIKDSNLFSFSSYLDSLSNEPLYELKNEELLKKMFLGEVLLSPSRIENFMNCRFNYFLRYLLGITPREPAEMSPINAGNFIHFIMEQVFLNVKGNLASCSNEAIYMLCEQAALRYENEVLAGAIENSNQLRYQLTRLSDQAVRLVMYLKNEQQQTDFKPYEFELPIADDGKVKPRELMTEDGTIIKVGGKIDRVDIAEIDGSNYLRVLDYKTGLKSFSLDDVYYGLNTQMLIYLFSLAEVGLDKYSKVTPAGVLYMPSDPLIPVIEEGIDRVKEAYRMDGMLLFDDKVLDAMEHDGEGVYIPIKKKDGIYRYSSEKSVSLEEMGSIKEHIDKLVVGMVETLKEGDIAAVPTVKSKKSPCDYCDYTSVCRSDRIVTTREIEKGAHKAFKGGEDND